MLSKITLGTMRLMEKGLSVQDVLTLLSFCLSSGVTSLHVSQEYESYNLLKESVQSRYRDKMKNHQLIAKLASPHFGEIKFSPSSLEEKIDTVLLDLCADKIDVIQWMWRMEDLDDDVRITRTQDQFNLIKETFDKLLKSGKVDKVSCFPYSKRYMKFVRESGLITSQIDYFNFWEDNLYDGGVHQDSIALRPLYAGKARDKKSALLDKCNEVTGLDENTMLGHCLRYPLTCPNIKTIVISMHNKKEIEEISKTSDSVVKSESLFLEYRRILGLIK